MEKLIYSGSYDFDAPALQLMDIHSRGVDGAWMQKRAAVLTEELDGLRPAPGKAYVHVIALGDGERYGENRNGDYFSKKANMERHHTFVTNGNLYLHHRNKDPKKRVGRVKYSAYNAKMGRVELVVEADVEKCAEYVEKVAAGDPDDLQGVSMACCIAADICSICGNKAPSRAAYCKHASTMLGRTLADGRKVYVDNPNPTFFDISWVTRPADRIAYGLRKVAAAGGEGVISGAELAELEGITGQHFVPTGPRSMRKYAKRHVLRKLSAIEKMIDGAIGGIDFSGHGGKLIKLRNAFSPEVACNESAATELHDSGLKLRKVLGGLAQARVSLPLKDFLRLVLGDEARDVDMGVVADQLPGIYSRLLEADDDDLCDDGTYDPMGGFSGLPMAVRRLIHGAAPSWSLDPGHIKRRITAVIVRKIPEPVLTGPARIHTIKFAADGRFVLAREYAKYKLSLLTKLADEGVDVSDFGVLQNYVAI